MAITNTNTKGIKYAIVFKSIREKTTWKPIIYASVPVAQFRRILSDEIIFYRGLWDYPSGATSTARP